MPQRLIAKHERADGELTARVDVPRWFTRDEAARALALVYPEQPVVTGYREVRTGLTRAARERVLSRPGAAPDEALVQAYVPVVDRHWQKFFKYDDQRQWVGAGHERASLTRLDVAVLFSREEAAVALALVYERVPSRVGRITIERGLQRAGAERVLARDGAERADAEVVQRFRELLGEVGPWSYGA